MSDTLIHSVRGSIERTVDDRGEAWTIFRLSGRSRDGHMAGQRVDVQTKRLEAHPDLFKRTLDRMALDLPRYDLV